MNDIFDKRNIEPNQVYTEYYIGYGIDDLSKMTLEQLENELVIIKREIDKIQSEINDADSYPSFAIKERLKNEYYYKDKVEQEIFKKKKSDEVSNDSVNNIKKMQEMIKDLERQYEKGNITKDYKEKYISKIEKSIKSCEEKIEREAIKEKEREEKEKSKKHKFKHFKNKIIKYKK